MAAEDEQAGRDGPGAGSVRQLAAELLRARVRPGEIGPQRVARAACAAMQGLAREIGDPGGRLQGELLQSTGLSAPMIEWALRAELGQVKERALLKLARSARSTARRRCVPARLVVCVLAGNVFTAGLRAVLMPLLVGAPVLAKASSEDDVLVRFFKQALDRADPKVGSLLGVVTFDRDRAELREALFESAEVVSVYGDDRTVQSIRQQLPAGCRLIAHGHGLGAIYLPASWLGDELGAAALARKAALDVAAYDQRGCFSPHFICVQQGSRVSAEGFARLLAEQGLRPLGRKLPRGRLSADAAAGQMQWRGVASARGTLKTGPDFAVSYEGRHEPRPSPGYRNLGVYECSGTDELGRMLAAFGHHLKALGVAGDVAERSRVAARLPAPLAPRICRVGRMQRPALDALADGRHPLDGLARWMDIER
jgi:hypothetical protein